MEIEHDDTDQEQEAARQRVEEELERRIDPAVAAPDADDHVHRDQHRLPEDVEQEQVERAEHPQHQRLHGQQTDHELLHLAVDRDPRGEHADPAQQRGQEHEERANPVDAKRVSDPERGHPRARLGELHLVGSGVKAGQHSDAESEVEDGDAQRRPPHCIVVAEKHQNRCPGGGHEHDKAKQRERHRTPTATPRRIRRWLRSHRRSSPARNGSRPRSAAAAAPRRRAGSSGRRRSRRRPHR